MRILGIFLLIIGLITLAIALTFDTTVYSGLSRVHNLGLMNQQQVTMILGGALAITGALLFGLSGRSASASQSGQVSADLHIAVKPLTTAYAGTRDISLPAYQLFLTRHFSIERDQTLGVFAVQEEVFTSLEDALRETDRQWGAEVAASEALAVKKKDEAVAEALKMKVDAEASAAAQKVAAKRIKRVLIIAVPTIVVLLGMLKMGASYLEVQRDNLSKYQAAQARVQDCSTLPSEDAVRCLKALKAEEACSTLSGIDSIKCTSDFMNN